MIEKNYNESLLRKDAIASSLVSIIAEIDNEIDLGNAAIYHQFPFYRDITNDSLVKANILFTSNIYGILIFQCTQISRDQELPSSVKGEILNLQTLDTQIFSRLIKSDILRTNRRELKFSINLIIYIPNLSKNQSSIDETYSILHTKNEIRDSIISNNRNYKGLSTVEYSELKALLEGSKVIPRKNERKIKENNNSKGAILSKIENEIAIFDSEQKRAALFTLDSPQRIRGLAGSGKTIILAMKAALIHIQDPSADILYTYYTKALHDYVKKLITRFYRIFSEKDPNWDKIHIMHAWGGKGLEGVYYNACIYNGISPISYRYAQSKSSKNSFSFVCEDIISYELKKQYDYSLLDEAQDFPKSFYQLCRKITHNDRIIWAYDDFQNILDVDIQNEKETFGKDENGNYYIDFSQKDEVLQDLILHKCYRNPRKNLVTAFALGLGIYNDNNKILQRLENNAHWESLGFRVEQGNSNTGEAMIISRPAENSPLIKNELLERDIFNIKVHENFNDECQTVVESVIKDIEMDLLPEDIAIISLDSKNVRTYFEVIEDLLNSRDIKTFSLINAPNDNIIYKVPGHVTLSTIFKAKGNESGSVYVVGIDAIFENKDSIVERNKLFTAITRSEAWVTLSGIGNMAQKCLNEYNKLVANEFKLIFTQPSKESTKTILREISQQQEKLNQIERIATELKQLGLSEAELQEKIINLVIGKK